MNRRIMLAVTGASGSVYAETFLTQVLPMVERVYLVASQTGLAVIQHELQEGSMLRRILKGQLDEVEKQKIRVFRYDDLFGPTASGSSVPTDMVIMPGSMGCVARIAQGVSSNLIERSADVMLKENKRLVIVPRETPLSVIHLENMLKLARAGVRMIPAMPAFYHKPQTLQEAVDFVVGRVFENLDMQHELYKKWNKRMC